MKFGLFVITLLLAALVPYVYTQARYDVNWGNSEAASSPIIINATWGLDNYFVWHFIDSSTPHSVVATTTDQGVYSASQLVPGYDPNNPNNYPFRSGPIYGNPDGSIFFYAIFTAYSNTTPPGLYYFRDEYNSALFGYIDLASESAATPSAAAATPSAAAATPSAAAASSSATPSLSAAAASSSATASTSAAAASSSATASRSAAAASSSATASTSAAAASSSATASRSAAAASASTSAAAASASSSAAAASSSATASRSPSSAVASASVSASSAVASVAASVSASASRAASSTTASLSPSAVAGNGGGGGNNGQQTSTVSRSVSPTATATPTASPCTKDTDGDGVPDCFDLCPRNNKKTAPSGPYGCKNTPKSSHTVIEFDFDVLSPMNCTDLFGDSSS